MEYQAFMAEDKQEAKRLQNQADNLRRDADDMRNQADENEEAANQIAAQAEALVEGAQQRDAAGNVGGNVQPQRGQPGAGAGAGGGKHDQKWYDNTWYDGDPNSDFSWSKTFGKALAGNVGQTVEDAALDSVMPWRRLERAAQDYEADRARGLDGWDAGLNAFGKNTPLVSAGWGLGEAITGQTRGGVDNGRDLNAGDRWGRVGGFVATEAGAAAVACYVTDVNPSIRVGLHPPHHGQGWHLQANTWKPGVKGSGSRWSIP
jgi:hypothetical protein